MARSTGMASEQLRALARLKSAAGIDRGSAIAISQSGVSLPDACAAYVKRFGVAESDLYHVTMGLTWFEDAETEPVRPKGLTAKHWKTIREYFEEQTPLLVLPKRR